LRSIESWLDRFCRKYSRFAIPDLMKYVVIANVLVYLLDTFSTTGYACSALLQFAPYEIFHGQIWRLVTFVFVPPVGGGLLFFALSMYFYYLIGTTLEREWGSAKFTVFYGMGVLFNVLAGLALGLVLHTGAGIATASMHYVNLSLFFAFATLYPDLQFLLFFIIPIKAKWLAAFDAGLFIWGIFQALIVGSIAGVVIPLLAILNYFLFFSSDISRLFGRVKYKTSKQTIHFKAAQKHAQEKKGYLHKCAVCGRTDTDNPGLEFRYCSKCNGYYCYCMDHINNHVHIE
jgi:hypothetical protein